MLFFAPSFCLHMAASASAAGNRPLNSSPSSIPVETDLDTVENLRRDAAELHCTGSYERPDGPKTATS
jgi:hypothetical protein